jgi:hypothetical protein
LGVIGIERQNTFFLKGFAFWGIVSRLPTVLRKNPSCANVFVSGRKLLL